MSCYHPVKAYSLASGGISFSERGDILGDIKVPCGRCIGCRLRRASDWSLRIGHEAQMHKQSWFVTLTYDDPHLPTPPSLNYREFQRFMKRLRKAHEGPVRFFMCAEYGERTRRPHYHAVLFGLQLSDLGRYGGPDDQPLFVSAWLTNLWGLGTVMIGAVTPKSAQYVARYNLKKVTGDLAEYHYAWVDEEGVVHQLEPEFCHMSTRPGIGATWYSKFCTDVHTHDYVIRDGVKNPVPRYYDKLATRRDDFEIDLLRQQRVKTARMKADNNTPERLAVREEVAKARAQLKQRLL